MSYYVIKKKPKINGQPVTHILTIARFDLLPNLLIFHSNRNESD